MRILLKVMIIVLLVGGASTGTYFVTKHYIFKQAYNRGYSVAYKKGYKRGNDIGYRNGSNDQKDKTSYQPFDFSAYNSGYNAGVANNAASTPAPQPTHCNSVSYGLTYQYTSTNCN